MLKSTINYLTTNIKFQSSEFQEDASPLSKQMKYALLKGLSAAQLVVVLIMRQERKLGHLELKLHITHLIISGY